MFHALCRWPAIVRALRSSQVRARLARRTRRRPGPRWIPLDQLEARAVPAVVTFNVTSLADSGPGTLRDAIAQADGGAASNKYVINIEKTGTITLESALPDLSRNITIKGLGSSNSTVQRDTSAPGFGIFKVDAGETVSLSGLTIARGDTNGNGGGVHNFGTVTVRDSTITGNSAAASGGGLENEMGGTATVSDSLLTGNTAGSGGGLDNSGTVTVSGSLVIGNSASFGGGLDSGGTLTVSDSIFTRNSADFGGGLSVFGTTVVSDSLITGNSADFAGGGLDNSGMVTVSDSVFTLNSAPSGLGGGLDNEGTAKVSDSLITGNSAGIDGGGIFNNGTLTQSGNIIIGNSPNDIS
jgi:hypothetical protein